MPKTPSTPATLSLRNDFVFGRVFSDPQNTPELGSFLADTLEYNKNDLTHITIVKKGKSPQQGDSIPGLEDIRLTDPHIYKSNFEGKSGLVDLKVLTNTNEIIHVEVQLNSIAGMAQRILFYHSHHIADQLNSGNAYVLLNKSISIIILNYNFLPINSKNGSHYHHRFVYHDPDHNLSFPNFSEIHTLELPKVPKDSDNTRLWNWVTFFATDDEEVKKKMSQLDPAIASIFQKLGVLSTQPEFRDFAEKRAKDLRDYASVIKDHEDQLKKCREECLEEGLEKGLEKGREEGREEGREKGRIETALNFLKMRDPAISVESIAKATCLTKEEVEALKKTVDN
jgi:predicted transposase/invertase (TIGR01784 family)